MKRALIICLLLAVSEASGYCANTMFPPLQPLKTIDQAPQTTTDNSTNYADNSNYNDTTAYDNGNNESQNIDRSNTNEITTMPDPFVSRPNSDNNLNNINLTKLGQIEMSLFNKSFANQSLPIRLSRIEKKLFLTTYPSADTDRRITNIVSNYNSINKYPNISKNDLSKIEMKVFNQVFPQNSPETRISRLEQKIFGAEQSGDLTPRYEAIKMVVKNSSRTRNVNSFDNFPQSAYRSGWGNPWGNGVMTGYTPPITQTNYQSNYGGYPSCNSYGQNRYNNRGGVNSFYDGDSSFGTGVGVKILD